MNILNNITIESLLIRTFLIQDTSVPLSAYIRIPVYKIYGPDPTFKEFTPFGNGYEISFTLTTCVDLRYIAMDNLLVEFVAVTTIGDPIQIGSEEGFTLIDVIHPPSLDRNLFTYTFKTLKPNNQPFKIRKYV